jgi:transposase
MLTNVEDAFRYLKSELNLRPMWHQKKTRVDAHLFNTILTYHLLVSIQYWLVSKQNCNKVVFIFAGGTQGIYYPVK